MSPEPSSDQLTNTCREIGRELRALAAAQASGKINQHEFVSALLKLELEKAAPHRLVLTASHTLDEWTVVSLRLPGRSEPCASFEFLPATGQFRPVGSPCVGADTAPCKETHENAGPR